MLDGFQISLTEMTTRPWFLRLSLSISDYNHWFIYKLMATLRLFEFVTWRVMLLEPSIDRYTVVIMGWTWLATILK